MNLAVFIKMTTFHKGYGGLETQNKSLCEGLAKKGYNVTVFTPKRDQIQDEIEQNGVKYVFIPSEYRMLFSSNKNSWATRSLLYFEKFHNETPFDLIMGQSSAAIGIMRKKQELGIKVVSIAHGSIISELRTRYKNLYSLKNVIRLVPDSAYAIVNFFTRQREYVHGSDRIIAVSKFVKNALIDETYADDKKFTVIHNGVDPEKFKGMNGDQDDEQKDGNNTFDLEGERILYIGQLIKEKGVDMLLKLFELPEGEPLLKYKLDIIGGGPLLNRLSKKVVSEGLTDNITVYGKKDFSDLLQFYTAPGTKAFVFPTKRFEGFPMVLVEAMMAGLPVVAFNLGGVPDAVEDGKTGYLVPEGDINEFRSSLLKLLNDKDKRREMSVYSYKKATANFTTDIMIDRYIKVFEEVKK